jgi:hypothetical protein
MMNDNRSGKCIRCDGTNVGLFTLYVLISICFVIGFHRMSQTAGQGGADMVRLLIQWFKPISNHRMNENIGNLCVFCSNVFIICWTRSMDIMAQCVQYGTTFLELLTESTH